MPRLNVRDAPEIQRSRQLTPEDAGAGVGRAVRQLGQTLGQSASRVEQAAQASRTIRQRAADTAARRAAVEFDTELEGRRAIIDLDPNVANREKAFDAEHAALTARFRPESNPIEFDFNSGISIKRHRNELRAGMRRDDIANMKSDVDFQVRRFSEQAATALDPADRAEAVIRGELEIERARADGALSQSEADKRQRGFLKGIETAIIQRFENDDPAEGMRFVESSQFQGTEEEKQVYRKRLISSAQRRLRNTNTSLAAQERRESLENKRLTRKALSKWNTGLANREIPTPDEVAEASLFLPASTADAWMKRALSGGVERGPSDPRLIATLTRRAQLGDSPESPGETSFSEELDTLLASGKISTIEFNTISTLRVKRNFGPGLSVLTRAADTLARFGNGPGPAIAAEQAKNAFMAFIEGNPDATRDEANSEAARLVKTIDPRNRAARGRPKRASELVIKNEDGTTDFEASMRNISEAKAKKGMHPDVADDLVEDLIDEQRELEEQAEMLRQLGEVAR